MNLQRLFSVISALILFRNVCSNNFDIELVLISISRIFCNMWIIPGTYSRFSLSEFRNNNPQMDVAILISPVQIRFYGPANQHLAKNFFILKNRPLNLVSSFMPINAFINLNFLCAMLPTRHSLDICSIE